MKKVLVAGATGQLGTSVVAQLKRRGYWVRACGRNGQKLQALKHQVGADDIVAVDLTDAGSVQGICNDVDAVISCAGASMSMNNFGDRKSFYEVDYQANLNLLADAERQKLSKFVYVSLAEAGKLRQTEYADAHEKFVEALRASGLNHTIIRPTGFFGFHLEILKFAAKGRGMLIGSGECRTNPVHEADVARACVDALESEREEVAVGGPEIFTRKETVELAFAVVKAAGHGQQPRGGCRWASVPAAPGTAARGVQRSDDRWRGRRDDQQGGVLRGGDVAPAGPAAGRADPILVGRGQDDAHADSIWSDSADERRTLSGGAGEAFPEPG